MPTYVTINCEKCKKEFQKLKSQYNEVIKREGINYCSRECFYSGRKPSKIKGTKEQIKCDNCQQIFFKYTSQLKLTDHNFCTRKCMASFRKGKKNVEYIQLTCSNCSKLFELRPSVYKTRCKQSTTNKLFCSFKCSRHSFKLQFSKVIRKRWIKRSKLEEYIEIQIKSEFPDLLVIYNGKYLGSELDLYIPSLGLAVEFNGICHYKSDVYGQLTLELTQKKDCKKKELCKEHDVELIIIQNFEDNRRNKVLSSHWNNVKTIITERLENPVKHKGFSEEFYSKLLSKL